MAVFPHSAWRSGFLLKRHHCVSLRVPSFSTQAAGSRSGCLKSPPYSLGVLEEGQTTGVKRTRMGADGPEVHTASVLRGLAPPSFRVSPANLLDGGCLPGCHHVMCLRPG